MSSRADKIEAGVDTEIDLLCAARLLLLQHIRLMLVVEKLDNWLPGVAVVDIVAEAGCVNDGQTDLTWLARSVLSLVPCKSYP